MPCRKSWKPLYGETFKTKSDALSRAKRIKVGHKKDFGKSLQIRVVKRKRKLIRKKHPYGLEIK